jgi:hypothetical protein
MLAKRVEIQGDLPVSRAHAPFNSSSFAASGRAA